MANSNLTNRVLHNWRRVDFDSPTQTNNDEVIGTQVTFTVNNNSILEGYDIANATSPSQIVTNPIDSLSTSLLDRVRMDTIDAISRHTVASPVYDEYTHTLSVDELPSINPFYHRINRNFVSDTTFSKPFITVSCGFDIFDGYLICSSQSWYEVRIEVIHKPSQEVLDLILKIYEGSRWEDRVK